MELESILSEFPFLQSARAVYLKGLYNQDSFRYNLELKKTAAHTSDRTVLFDFITSEQFQSIQKRFLEEKEKAVGQIHVTDIETIETVPIQETTISPLERIEQSIKLTIEAGEQHKEEPVVTKPVSPQITEEIIPEEPAKAETVIEAAEEKLEIGKPLEFSKQETHSFQEWLQLSRLTPINRDEEIKPEATAEEPKEERLQEDDAKSKKLELIDKFIEANPKIPPIKTAIPAPANIERSSSDNSLLMTETLAKVYLEQKKYQKAIQAYEILILKYPEKSAFFADRISDIKILQQNNS